MHVFLFLCKLGCHYTEHSGKKGRVPNQFKYLSNAQLFFYQVEKFYEEYQQYISQENYVDALKLLNAILDYIGGWDDLQLKKVECLAKSGNTEDAMKYFQTLEQSSYPRYELFYLKGIIFLYSGQR